jgi:hypothetical protein
MRHPPGLGGRGGEPLSPESVSQGSGPLPPGLGGRGGALAPAEAAAIAADLARAAVRLVETADELVTASAARRPTLRATLYRWQTVLALGAQRLAQPNDDRA